MRLMVILVNMIIWHCILNLEDLYKLANQYFSNDQGMVLENKHGEHHSKCKIDNGF